MNAPAPIPPVGGDDDAAAQPDAEVSLVSADVPPIASDAVSPRVPPDPAFLDDDPPDELIGDYEPV